MFGWFGYNQSSFSGPSSWLKTGDDVPLVQGEEVALALSSHCHPGKHPVTSPFKYSNNHDLDTDPNIQHQKERGGGGGQEASFQAET